MDLEEKSRVFKDLNQKDWVKSLQENNVIKWKIVVILKYFV